MGVAEPLRRPTASRGRKRPRAAARLVGTSRAACCRPRLRVNPFLVWFVFLWLLFSGVWETLIFGTGDWFAFGEPFFCGLFTPTYPLPGHRLVPESHIVSVSLWTNLERVPTPKTHPLDSHASERWPPRAGKASANAASTHKVMSRKAFAAEGSNLFSGVGTVICLGTWAAYGLLRPQLRRPFV